MKGESVQPTSRWLVSCSSARAFEAHVPWSNEAISLTQSISWLTRNFVKHSCEVCLCKPGRFAHPLEVPSK